MLSIRHVALRVRDLSRSIDFYTRVLGMKVEWQPDDDNVYLTNGTDNLALHQAAAAEKAPVDAVGLDHFGFVVAAPEEVDRWAELLEGRGIELVQKPKTHRDGARSIYFRDPDKNLIQLLYHSSLI